MADRQWHCQESNPNTFLHGNRTNNGVIDWITDIDATIEKIYHGLFRLSIIKTGYFAYAPTLDDAKTKVEEKLKNEEDNKK